MAEDTNTVEIIEPVANTEPKEAPSRDELKQAGWTAKELDSAEKLGMVKKAEEPKEEEKKEEPKQEAAKVEEKKIEPKRVGSLPELNLTPDQEAKLTGVLPPGDPVRGMYFRMKNERAARQAAEAKVKEFEARLKEFETKKPAPVTDETGTEIDPENQPLTLRQLREMREQEERERIEREQQIREQGGRVTEALKLQEEYAKAIHEDFDQTVTLAKELVQKADELLPDRKSQARLKKLIQDLHVASANADQYDVEDFNAADISYEIGKLHPSYGKSANGHSADTDGNTEQPRPEKANGGLTPEQMKRMEQNTQRRASSASIPGSGGRRVVSADDVGLKELTQMNPSQLLNFRTKYPERYARLLRG